MNWLLIKSLNKLFNDLFSMIISTYSYSSNLSANILTFASKGQARYTNSGVEYDYFGLIYGSVLLGENLPLLIRIIIAIIKSLRRRGEGDLINKFL